MSRKSNSERIRDSYFDLSDEPDSGSYEHEAEESPRSRVIGRHVLTSEGDSIRAYLNAIGRWPLLSADEEVNLSKIIEAGIYAEHKLAKGDICDEDMVRDLQILVDEGAEAKHTFVRSNLRLVVSIANRYVKTNQELMDRTQEGNLGLIHAVEKFDYKTGFKFSTYATWWIKQAITRAIADKDRSIRLPVHVYEKFRKILKTKNLLLAENGSEPSVEEIAEATNLPVEQVALLLEAGQDTASLDMPLSDDMGGETLGSVFASTLQDGDVESQVEAGERNRILLQTIYSILTDREIIVLAMRHGLKDGQTYSYNQIGEQLGIQRTRVRQIEEEAFKKIRVQNPQLALFII